MLVYTFISEGDDRKKFSVEKEYNNFKCIVGSYFFKFKENEKVENNSKFSEIVYEEKNLKVKVKYVNCKEKIISDVYGIFGFSKILYFITINIEILYDNDRYEIIGYSKNLENLNLVKKNNNIYFDVIDRITNENKKISYNSVKLKYEKNKSNLKKFLTFLNKTISDYNIRDRHDDNYMNENLFLNDREAFFSCIFYSIKKFGYEKSYDYCSYHLLESMCKDIEIAKTDNFIEFINNKIKESKDKLSTLQIALYLYMMIQKYKNNKQNNKILQYKDLYNIFINYLDNKRSNKNNFFTSSYELCKENEQLFIRNIKIFIAAIKSFYEDYEKESKVKELGNEFEIALLKVKMKNKHFGKIGDKININCTVFDIIKNITTKNGNTINIVKVFDENYISYSFFQPSEKNDKEINIGDKILLSGKIKDHKIYESLKENILSNVKFEKI